ncbi:MAG: DUF4112 domain-containing protein [Planctomycetota bacterium]
MKSRRVGNEPILTMSQRQGSPQMEWVDQFTRTLDTRLRIPGTNIRFGVDFILGLVPGAGDFISLCLSGLLILTMAKNGATPKLVAKMLGNVLLDAIAGTVPFIGNVFDLVFKANTRNLLLMREYYEEDQHRGPIWPIVLGISLVLLLIGLLIVWLIYKLYQWMTGLFTG